MKKYIAVLSFFVCAAANAQWAYTDNTDKMTGKKNFSASATSDNQLSFDFPYKGNNWGFLTIRQHPQYGLNVIVSITKGQMLCHTYDCTVSVKFDDGKPVKYSGTGPADHSSTSIFIDNASKFIAGAKKAKKILIQFNAYHNGSPVLEFSTPQTLDWPRK